MFQGFLVKIVDCKNAFVISSIATCNYYCNAWYLMWILISILDIFAPHAYKMISYMYFWFLLWTACFCESFEPRGHFLSRLSMIVGVNVVLNRTVLVDSDWRFDNLSGSHLQSQSELYHASWWYWHNSLWLWRWLYCTGCRNNNSPIQDYVHPDTRTQPTYLMFLLSIWLNVCRR